MAEYAAPGGTSCGALVRSYTWGLDIVNTMAKAGGVGALLQIADHPSGKTFLPTYDGNGNIVALLNASTGALAAAYEFSPFGEPLRAQTLDPVVADNPFRFSTKFTDVETGLVYYGHRYYDPKNGRFINRDPIEESGGLNLYGFCGNDSVNRWDYLGMDAYMDWVPYYDEFGNVAGTRYMEADGMSGADFLNSYLAGASQLGGFSPRYNDSGDSFAGDMNQWKAVTGVTEAARQTNFQVDLAYLNAGFSGAGAIIASATETVVLGGLNAGIETAAHNATASLPIRSAEAILNDTTTFSFTLPPTGSVTIGDAQAIAFYDGPVAATATVNPAAQSSIATAPNSGGGLTVGEFLIAVATGAGEGFQKNVIDPLGTAAGLVVYTNIPGTITVGGGVGLGGFVSVSRDSDGRIAVVGGAGFAGGAQFDVSTNTPTLTTNSLSVIAGVSTNASVNVGGVNVGAGGQVLYAGATNNDFTVTSRLNTNLAVGSIGGGREGGIDIFGNASSRNADGRLGGGNYATVGIGGLLFWGPNVGVASGPKPRP